MQLQYLFEGGVEMPVILPPHGNTKETTSYCRTQPSILNKLKDEHGNPKAVVSEMYKEAGFKWKVYNARQH